MSKFRDRDYPPLPAPMTEPERRRSLPCRARRRAGIDIGPLARRRGGDRQFRRRASRPPRRDRRRAQRAQALGRKAAALTFAPHPRLFLRPQDAAVPAHQRARQAAPAGGERARRRHRHDLRRGARRPPRRTISSSASWSDASASAARRSASTFISARTARGSPAFLAEQGARLGFAVDIVPPLEDEGRPVSSGAVRAALAAGKVVEATELLGAPWFVSGEVIHGDKRGRELGFPTANLQARSGLRPQARHLCGARRRRRQRHDGVASFGRAADVRQRRAAAGGVPVRFRRRPLRAGDRRRLHRLDPPRAEIRHRSRRSSAT